MANIQERISELEKQLEHPNISAPLKAVLQRDLKELKGMGKAPATKPKKPAPKSKNCNTNNKSPKLTLGKKIRIKIPNGEVRDGQFALIDLSDLLASHNEVTFAPSKDYPTDKKGESINDRNYSGDKNYQAKVLQIARELDPDRLIDTSKTPDGTPIIVPSGIVVSGNNRVMSMKLAKKDYPNQYQKYGDYLEEEIDIFGLNKSDLKEFTDPTIVRIDNEIPECNTTELSKYNQSEKKAERPIDRAIKLGKIVDDNEQCKRVITSIVGNYETFSEFYQNYADQKKMFNSLSDCNIITSQEKPKYFSESGFTSQGKELINNLLAGMILDKGSLIVAESVKNFRAIIITSLPVLIANDSYPESLKKSINEAILIEGKIRNANLNFSTWINQISLFDDPPNRDALYINRLLASGRNNFKRSIEKYNDSLKANQGESLFGDKPSRQEIFEAHIINNIPKSEQKLIEGITGKSEAPTPKKTPKTNQDTYLIVETWNGEGYSEENLISETKKFSNDKEAKNYTKGLIEKNQSFDEIDPYSNGWGWLSGEDNGSYQYFKLKPSDYGVVILTNINEVKVLNKKEYEQLLKLTQTNFISHNVEDMVLEDAENGTNRYFFGSEDVNYQKFFGEESDAQFEKIKNPVRAEKPAPKKAPAKPLITQTIPTPAPKQPTIPAPAPKQPELKVPKKYNFIEEVYGKENVQKILEIAERVYEIPTYSQYRVHTAHDKDGMYNIVTKNLGLVKEQNPNRRFVRGYGIDAKNNILETPSGTPATVEEVELSFGTEQAKEWALLIGKDHKPAPKKASVKRKPPAPKKPAPVKKDSAKKKPAPKKKSSVSAKKKYSKTAKSKAKKKDTAEKIKALKKNPKYKKALKGVSSKNIEKDLSRKALPVGKRVSKSGNTYYEYRRKMSDINQNKKI